MIKIPFEKEYVGYHKQYKIVGPVDYDKMMYWRNIIRLRWVWRKKR